MKRDRDGNKAEAKSSGSSKRDAKQKHSPNSFASQSDSGKRDSESKTNKNGLDEIDSLFSQKKTQTLKESSSQGGGKDEAKRKKPRHGGSVGEPTSSKRRRATGAVGNASSGDWVDDGRGGRYNGEGYTGRVEDGIRIFKAHVLNGPSFGSTPQCPFDCDCCVI